MKMQTFQTSRWPPIARDCRQMHLPAIAGPTRGAMQWQTTWALKTTTGNQTKQQPPWWPTRRPTRSFCCTILWTKWSTASTLIWAFVPSSTLSIFLYSPLVFWATFWCAMLFFGNLQCIQWPIFLLQIWDCQIYCFACFVYHSHLSIYYFSRNGSLAHSSVIWCRLLKASKLKFSLNTNTFNINQFCLFAGVSVYISVFTLMSIALERYSVIVHPFRRPITISSCIAIIIFIWILAFIFTLPYGIFIDVITMIFIPSNIMMRNTTQPESINRSRVWLSNYSADSQEMREIVHQLVGPPKLYCDEVWPSDNLRLIFGLSTTVVQFIVPFCIITFCYARVCARLWDRIRSRPGSRNCSSQRKWLEKERARKTNTMLICVVVVFGLSWLPLNTYNLVR